MEHTELIRVARDYVHHLVLGDFGYSNGLRVLDDVPLLAPDYVAQTLADYGATLIAPPEAAFVLAPPYAAWVEKRAIEVNLWTVEEGESNLQLDVDLTTASPHHIVDGSIRGCPPRIIPALQEVVHHLVVGDYKGLEDHGHLRRCGVTGEWAEGAIIDYRDRTWQYSEPRTVALADFVLVDIPQSAFKHAYAGHIFGTPGAWTADIELWWTANGLKGDLTLRMEIDETDDGIDVQVVGIEVM